MQPAGVSFYAAVPRAATGSLPSRGAVVERAPRVVDKAAKTPAVPMEASTRVPSSNVGRAPPQVSEARYEYQRICRATSSRTVAPESIQPSIVKAATFPMLDLKALSSTVQCIRGNKSVSTTTSPPASIREEAVGKTRKLVSIVAPGGGTFANKAVYTDLARSSRLRVEFLGQARAEYDRYPEAFNNGSPAPNLESFAGSLLAQGAVEKSDCLVVGSRGGQVVLPHLWKTAGTATPPAFVINGGCAMELPEAPCWPDEAVTFLLMGGHDHFRAKFSAEGYVADAKARVPSGNSTTALLYVNEMEHMPQSALLRATLHPAIGALLLWQESRRAPLEDFQFILASLTAAGFSGVLAYTGRKGEWKDLQFGAQKSAPAVAAARVTTHALRRASRAGA